MDEIQSVITDQTGCTYHATTIARVLRREGFTYRRIHFRAKQRDDVQRQAFKDRIEGLEAECFIFVDETHCNARTGLRRFGWVRRGMGPPVSLETFAGRQFTLIAAINGVVGVIPDACRVIEHTAQAPGTTSRDFENYVDDNLYFVLGNYERREPNSVLILDNCSIHDCRSHLENVCRERGCLLRFLSPYSPDFNPIEEAFSEFKAHIKRDTEFFKMNPVQCIIDAFKIIPLTKIRSYFNHAGYYIQPEAVLTEEFCMTLIAMLSVCLIAILKLKS